MDALVLHRIQEWLELQIGSFNCPLDNDLGGMLHSWDMLTYQSASDGHSPKFADAVQCGLVVQVHHNKANNMPGTPRILAEVCTSVCKYGHARSRLYSYQGQGGLLPT